jgi:hypothetical protein
LRATPGESSDEDDIRKKLRSLQQWFEEDTERASEAGFVTGVVLLSVGGGAAVLTGLGVAASPFARTSISDTAGAICGGVIAGGLAAAGIGIGLIVSGGPRVMKTKAPSSTTSLFSPSARLLVSPGMTGIGGTF